MTDPISNERLAELAYEASKIPQHADLCSALRELQSRRQSSAGIAEALRELVRCVRGGDETAGFSMDDALVDADAALSCLSVEPAGVEPASDYDAGLLSDYGGGNVDWWQNYLRAEIGRANDYWRSHLEDSYASPPKAVTITDEMVERAYEGWDAYWPTRQDVSGYGAMRAALTAALSCEARP